MRGLFLPCPAALRHAETMEQDQAKVEEGIRLPSFLDSDGEAYITLTDSLPDRPGNLGDVSTIAGRWINREQAIAMIAHLQELFNLAPAEKPATPFVQHTD